jgi:hypothetical protein
VQRQPDTRVHCVRSDGTVAVLVFDKLEQVICWLERRDGRDVIEDAYVVPGDAGVKEDSVYYQVKRTINGATKRFLEKQARGVPRRATLTVNKQADAFITYNQAASSTITVSFPHLAGEEVVVWDNGKCRATSNGRRSRTSTRSRRDRSALRTPARHDEATQGMVGMRIHRLLASRSRFAELMGNGRIAHRHSRSSPASRSSLPTSTRRASSTARRSPKPT